MSARITPKMVSEACVKSWGQRVWWKQWCPWTISQGNTVKMLQCTFHPATLRCPFYALKASNPDKRGNSRHHRYSGRASNIQDFEGRISFSFPPCRFLGKLPGKADASTTAIFYRLKKSLLWETIYWDLLNWSLNTQLFNYTLLATE